MSKLLALSHLGQAIWLDFIRRSYILAGELGKLVKEGLRGVTSNPTIFEQAIAGSTDYDEDLYNMAKAGYSDEEIYESLVLEDIRLAADTLYPVYEHTHGSDGYVSLEVSPKLANDTEKTISEAQRLFATLNRPNVMIKIPATSAGILAVEEVTSRGINVNATLIFSMSHYTAVAYAYIKGLERLASNGGDISRVASVASFFVSRVDTAVDKELQSLGEKQLQGKLAIANSKLAYARYKEIFSTPQWKALAARGARTQRPLWASTGTKNHAYPDTLYVDNLIGADTINTLPPTTLQAFLEHGNVSLTLESDITQARSEIAHLSELGIDLDAITQRLQEDGVAAFARSFESLMSSIAAKRRTILASQLSLATQLGSYQPSIDKALEEITRDRIISRIWDMDFTIWKSEPDEITNRLGWLHVAEEMTENLVRLEEFAKQVRSEGYLHALLLGMGGSSLAPEVLAHTIDAQAGHLKLAVLDSTDPGAVLTLSRQLDLSKTLFIVSSKSGGTVETLSFFKYFYNHMVESFDDDRAGKHFIAITDPGSKLVEVARHYKFREIFLNDPNIGGRYSALSYFGLVPAALAGLDIKALLDQAMIMSYNNRSTRIHIHTDESSAGRLENTNIGAHLGVIMGELASAGRDKLTIIASPVICRFGDWVEQLVAESTGKEGVGILPVVDEVVGNPNEYSPDRLFVYMRMANDSTFDKAIMAFENAGHPTVTIHLKDPYGLGGQFFLWEMATAVAGYRLGINPFDQPNVEMAKVLARKMMADYQQTGRLPESNPTLNTGAVSVFGGGQITSLQDAWKSFIAQAQEGSYIALQAYIQPSDEAIAALFELRTLLRKITRLAITTGYGPRFLHSTGQLHKGDAGKGLFIQITADDIQDLPIPDEAGKTTSSMSFGKLKMAQAAGDRLALMETGRRVIRFHLGDDISTGLAHLTQALSEIKVTK